MAKQRLLPSNEEYVGTIFAEWTWKFHIIALTFTAYFNLIIAEHGLNFNKKRTSRRCVFNRLFEKWNALFYISKLHGSTMYYKDIAALFVKIATLPQCHFRETTQVGKSYTGIIGHKIRRTQYGQWNHSSIASGRTTPSSNMVSDELKVESLVPLASLRRDEPKMDKKQTFHATGFR